MRHIDPNPVAAALIAFASLASIPTLFRTRGDGRRRARMLLLILWTIQLILMWTCAAAVATGADLLFYTSGAALLIAGILVACLLAFTPNVTPTRTRENP